MLSKLREISETQTFENIMVFLILFALVGGPLLTKKFRWKFFLPGVGFYFLFGLFFGYLFYAAASAGFFIICSFYGFFGKSWEGSSRASKIDWVEKTTQNRSVKSSAKNLKNINKTSENKLHQNSSETGEKDYSGDGGEFGGGGASGKW